MTVRARTARLIAVSATAIAFVGAEAATITPRADAAHHLVRIRQVYPGNTTTPSSEFVVLQLTNAGENQLFNTVTVQLYDSVGLENSGTFSMNPANGETQRTVLVATTNAELDFTASADLELTNTDAVLNAAGAACMVSSTFGGGIDCVEWGSGTAAALPSPAGTLEPAIPADSMLERSITASCPTLFETTDDTNDGANDFAPVAISPGSFTPRNNAAAVTETACTTLSVVRAGTGTGSVAGNGTPSIACPTTCFTYFQTVDTANLTATPDIGSTFAGWTNCPTPSGMDCSAPMNLSRTITANFQGMGGSTPPITPVVPTPTPTPTAPAEDPACAPLRAKLKKAKSKRKKRQIRSQLKKLGC